MDLIPLTWSFWMTGYLFIIIILPLAGCSIPVIKIQKPLPPIVKKYENVTYYTGNKQTHDTGVYLTKGELFSILTADIHLRNRLVGMIGIDDFGFYLKDIDKAYQTGKLFLENINKNDRYVNADIIVWEKDDYVQIADFLKELKEIDPDNSSLRLLSFEIERRKNLYLESKKASVKIAETKKEIEELKKEEKAQLTEHTLEKNVASVSQSIVTETDANDKISGLETKLNELTETLSQLEEMKKKWEEERKRTSILTKELDEKQKREQELLTKLEQSSKNPPIIVVSTPKDGSSVDTPVISLSGIAADDQGLQRFDIFLNNIELKHNADRGIKIDGDRQKSISFKERIRLEKGQNQIKLRAVDSGGLFTEKIITVHKFEKSRNIWAVVIGINDYREVRGLRYAVNDAKAFYRHLVKYNKVPAENIILLLNEDTNLTKLRSTLGTHLKNKAGKEDMVIIYFAGHGATEKDVMSPDGDGLEKYLLPYDVDPKDLYATALPMGEISRIFNRIRSERLIFIADSCYSGASGGRTISLAGIRANISDGFLDRIAAGRGKVILTASGANEVSEENENLGHGVFTYFLLEGLRGSADTDQDGLITVDEVYRYVSSRVPEATRQEQHPVKKGTTKGQLVLSVVE